MKTSVNENEMKEVMYSEEENKLYISHLIQKGKNIRREYNILSPYIIYMEYIIRICI